MTSRQQILIVDDDEEIVKLLPDFLSPYGYVAHVANDGVSMQRQLSEHAIDLLILDVMLPGADGVSLARELRRRSRLPIIMLTARADPYDRVVGLEAGADDYVIKPFQPRELVARIQTVLRRAGRAYAGPAIAGRCDKICFDGWELHRQNHCLHSPDGLVIALSNAEFRLLCTLLQKPRRPFRREELVDHAHRHTIDSGIRSIDLLISRLRHKLAGAADGLNMIRTMRGVGYMLHVKSVQGHMTWRD